MENACEIASMWRIS